MLKSFVGRENPVRDTRGHGQFSILEADIYEHCGNIIFRERTSGLGEGAFEFSGDNRRENLK